MSLVTLATGVGLLFSDLPINKPQDWPLPNPTMHHSEQKCAHFCSEWHIVKYGTAALWDLYYRFIPCQSQTAQISRYAFKSLIIAMKSPYQSSALSVTSTGDIVITTCKSALITIAVTSHQRQWHVSWRHYGKHFPFQLYKLKHFLDRISIWIVRKRHCSYIYTVDKLSGLSEYPTMYEISPNLWHFCKSLQNRSELWPI